MSEPLGNYAETRLADALQANDVNYNLRLQAEEKFHEIYRRVFPEEAPWAPVHDAGQITHSPYQWDKLLQRIDELVAASRQ